MVSGRITDLRQQHGLDQKEFGAMIGVSQVMVSRYEQGATPSPKVLDAIKEKFGVDLREPTDEAKEVADILQSAPKGKVAALKAFLREWL